MLSGNWNIVDVRNSHDVGKCQLHVTPYAKAYHNYHNYYHYYMILTFYMFIGGYSIRYQIYNEKSFTLNDA